MTDENTGRPSVLIPHDQSSVNLLGQAARSGFQLIDNRLADPFRMHVYARQADLFPSQQRAALQVGSDRELLARPEVLVPAHALYPGSLWQGGPVLLDESLDARDDFWYALGSGEGELEVVAVFQHMAVCVYQALRSELVSEGW